MNYKLVVVVVLVILLVWYLFEEVDDNSPKFVFFSADWCPHCQEFQPTWDSLEDKVRDLRSRVYIKAPEEWVQKIKTGYLDQITFKQVPHTEARKYDVGSYPTLRFYPVGLEGSYVEYKGNRSAESILKFVASQV